MDGTFYGKQRSEYLQLRSHWDMQKIQCDWNTRAESWLIRNADFDMKATKIKKSIMLCCFRQPEQDQEEHTIPLCSIIPSNRQVQSKNGYVSVAL